MRYKTYSIQTGNLRSDKYLHDFFISVQDVPEHPDYPEHTHEFTELVVVYEGNGINCVGSFEYPIAAGDVFVLHSGQKHAYKQTSHLHLCNVLFDSNMLGLQSLDMKHLPGFHALFVLEPQLRKANFNSRLHLEGPDLIKARNLIEEIEQEVDEQNPGFRLISQSLLLLLIGKLSRWYAQATKEDSAKLMLIAKSLAHMEQKLYEPLSIEQLAKMANMSERNFYRTFQKATGVSPNQHLTNLRISQATELLKHSDASITEIAFECGFQDSSYMTKQFKKHMGLTPSMFRKINHS
ncbi:helix-turn-helix domain-containing protein [Tichowtungia aerotolerans]|uniref:Helix-turn-helix domain-containing protein n=1 Tax=Tichowtungia aerotolerans TaxID=2697043 RepID=A0A6P1M664_9BACT|nr:helix-turn-helix domain-containing protein [Tichowtungia aerotolerans]QHI68493.1 helix-turn-helix domain-containing protein [Tichowtungia aerotolerans]